MEKIKFNTLIFEGGGVRGLSYLGALNYLEEKNILNDIKYFGGTSSGSQIATLLAIGYSLSELKKILFNTPFNKFMDKDNCFLSNFCCFFCNYGLYNGDYLKNYLEKLIYEKMGKKNATFKDLWYKKKCHLKITGTCIERKKIEIFDYINNPEMPLSLAIKISSSIPFFYKPVKFNDYTYVDGGLIKNFPINIFDDINSDTYINTLALELISDDDINDSDINSFSNFSKAIISTMHTAANKNITNKNIKIVGINTGYIKATDFDISLEEKEYLIKMGYKFTKEILE